MLTDGVDDASTAMYENVKALASLDKKEGFVSISDGTISDSSSATLSQINKKFQI